MQTALVVYGILFAIFFVAFFVMLGLFLTKSCDTKCKTTPLERTCLMGNTKVVDDRTLNREWQMQLPHRRLQMAHKQIKIDYGSLSEEYHEQLMTVQYLESSNKVLELGGNIGRNSLVVATLLDDQTNLVTLECDKEISNQLKHNRELNEYTFRIETSALSYRPLIRKGWDTKPGISEEGYTKVDTLTFKEIEEKYNIIFDTLIADCEGALYYILKDNTEMLNHINTIIVENDYWDIEQYNYVSDIFKSKGFYSVFSQAGGWGPCRLFFFQVWAKNK